VPACLVLETRIAVSNEVREKSLDVMQHARISVLADNQACARMPTEDVTEPSVERSFCDDRRDLLSNLVNATTVRRNFDLFLEHAPYPLG
jgi:hypothetical protein